MWSAYAPGQGVAIRSTKGRLKESIRPPAADHIMIGVVEYGEDWSKGQPRFCSLPNGYSLVKRRAFKWEHELRAYLPYEYEFDRDGRRIEPMHLGSSVRVELATLLTEIWVAPYAPAWFEALVRNELETYGHVRVPVKKRQGDPFDTHRSADIGAF